MYLGSPVNGWGDCFFFLDNELFGRAIPPLMAGAASEPGRGQATPTRDFVLCDFSPHPAEKATLDLWKYGGTTLH
jgi:hypothetical protein